MLKITQAGGGDQAVTLHLEGRAVGPWVAELLRSCELALLQGHRLRLDLREVEYVDGNAVSLLRNLRARGVRFVACPPFVAQQLKGISGSAPPAGRQSTIPG